MTQADISTFGTTATGAAVQRIALRNGAISANILTYGAILQGLWLRGSAASLTLGSDQLADYEGAMRNHGSLVAPVANRLSGAQAPINGALHRFEANQGGIHSLHSGAASTQGKIWTIAEATDTAVTLAITLPDGEGGFPGNRDVTARFALTTPQTLRLTVTATSDRPTLFNAANHSYWNLDGSDGWDGHSLQINAAAYLPTTETFTPTGEIAATSGTPFDFRGPRIITPENPALDHNFCLAPARRGLTEALILTGKRGLRMTIATTEPGIQVYDGRRALRPGRNVYEGLAIEPQAWPDAPNHPDFPPITLAPGAVYEQISEWRFSRV